MPSAIDGKTNLSSDFLLPLFPLFVSPLSSLRGPSLESDVEPLAPPSPSSLVLLLAFLEAPVALPLPADEFVLPLPLPLFPTPSPSLFAAEQAESLPSFLSVRKKCDQFCFDCVFCFLVFCLVFLVFLFVYCVFSSKSSHGDSTNQSHTIFRLDSNGNLFLVGPKFRPKIGRFRSVNGFCLFLYGFWCVCVCEQFESI